MVTVSALVTAAVQGGAKGGGSRRVVAAATSAAVRTAVSLLRMGCGAVMKAGSYGDSVLEEQSEVVGRALAVHRADCLRLGFGGHQPSVAASLVRGAEAKAKVALHRLAGYARHRDLHSDSPLGGVRGMLGRREGRPHGDVPSAPTSRSRWRAPTRPISGQKCFLHGGSSWTWLCRRMPTRPPKWTSRP